MTTDHTYYVPAHGRVYGPRAEEWGDELRAAWSAEECTDDVSEHRCNGAARWTEDDGRRVVTRVVCEVPLPPDALPGTKNKWRVTDTATLPRAGEED